MPSAKPKMVYHLSGLEQVNFVLGNIQNHFDGIGGPENVTIALVIPTCRGASENFRGWRRARRLQQHHEIAERQPEGAPPGFVVADKGGGVRLAELQAQGYLYLKP